MSNFKHYATKLDEIATSAFKEYNDVKERYDKAEQFYKQNPERAGIVQADYAATSARAKADFLQAQDEMNAAKIKLQNRKGEIDALRKELASAMSDHYSADPDAIDSKTMELLKSNTLQPNEYVGLINKAQSDKNYTMARVIAKYAQDAAKHEADNNGRNTEAYKMLLYAADAGNKNDSGERMAAFDLMATLYDKCVNNPPLMSEWQNLTANAKETF